MDLIKNLEEKLFNSWKSTNFDQKEFPSLAGNLLRELDIPDPFSLLKRALINLPFNQQNHQRGVFADIPFTLLKNEYFSIDLFFWFHSHTSIHDHPFSGAFKVLQGSSKHLVYNFEDIIELEHWLFKGELKLVKEEKIFVGDVQEIVSGFDYIHQVLHIENPTITLVVKSAKTVQFRDYLYPNFGWVDRYPNPDFFKKLSIVSSFFKYNYKSGPDACHRALREVFETIPAHDLFLMTYNYRPLYSGTEFEQKLEDLIKSDDLRFPWYNQIKNARVSHKQFISSLSLF